MSAEDVPDMIKDMRGRLAGHRIPPGEIIFRAPGTLQDEPERVPEPDLSTIDGLRRFVHAEVRVALDELARAMREQVGLRPSPMAEDEGR